LSVRRREKSYSKSFDKNFDDVSGRKKAGKNRTSNHLKRNLMGVHVKKGESIFQFRNTCMDWWGVSRSLFPLDPVSSAPRVETDDRTDTWVRSFPPLFVSTSVIGTTSPCGAVRIRQYNIQSQSVGICPIIKGRQEGYFSAK
jgi:hypothetical protein